MTAEQLAQEQIKGRGVIQMGVRDAEEFYPELFDIDKTTVQGDLKTNGTFAALHERLRLPEDYTILGIYYEVWAHRWNILVEHADIPLPEPGGMYPRVLPTYRRNADRTTSLVKIAILN